MSYLEIRSPWNKRKVESAEELWATFMEYVAHSDTTPLVEPKIFSTKTGVVTADLDKVRPYTLEAFCNYVGIHTGTWANWKKNNDDEFFLDVQLQIESIVNDQMFQGAMVNIFNATISSRKLGLAERSELTGINGGPIETREMSPRERINSKLASLSSRESAFNNSFGDDE